MTTVFNIISQDTTRCKSPKANIRESVIGPMCLRIRSVNTNLVPEFALPLSSGASLPVPLDKGDEDSGNAIAWTQIV